jgi:class 3 adenylate cyclase
MCDLHGFFHFISEDAARKLSEILNVFLGAMTVRSPLSGTIDEFIGDAILVLLLVRRFIVKMMRRGR